MDVQRQWRGSSEVKHQVIRAWPLMTLVADEVAMLAGVSQCSNQLAQRLSAVAERIFYVRS